MTGRKKPAELRLAFALSMVGLGIMVVALLLALTGCPGLDTTAPGPTCVGGFDLSCGRTFKGSVCAPFGQDGFRCQLPCVTNADCGQLGRSWFCAKTEFGSFCQANF